MLTVSQGLIFTFFSAATCWMITEKGHDANFNLTFSEYFDTNYVNIVHIRDKMDLLFRMWKNTKIKYYNSYDNRVNVTTFAPTKGIIFNLRNVTSKDAGKYVCHLKGHVDKPICTELLIVTDTPKKPILSVNDTAEGGKILTLSCSSNSTSLPSDHNLTMNYVWRRNRLTLPNDKTPHKDGSHFTMPNISKEENGVNYSCQAKEQHGLRSVWSDDVTLDVQYGPDRAVLSPDTNMYNVTENNLLTVKCCGDCNPACNVTWWDNDGQEVTPVRTVLQIRPTRTMAGKYKCKVSNIHGRSSNHFDINVMYVPSINTFTVNNGKKVTVREREAFNFICTGDSNPTPVVTFISDMNSPIVPDSTLVPPHGFSSSYTISSVSCSHHGRYYCQAANSIGSTKDSVDIKVKCGPRQRDTIRQQTNSSTASWRFSVWAYPMPEENIFFSNQTDAARSITTGHKYQLKHISIRENLHEYTFLIQNVDSDDFGKYTIMIQNVEGSKNISISLVEEESVVKQGDTPFAIIVAAICSLLFVVATICAAVYIKRYKNRKEEGEERSVSYLSPRRLSSRSNESPYATINMEDFSMESASDIRDDYQRLQSESPNHIYRALYPKVEPGKARHHKCSIICGCLSVQCGIVKQ